MIPKRVVSLAPMPPEKCAYALARYSRSPDSIRDSIAWVKDRDSAKFLEHFYFQYGHASIADLGHAVLCFEGISDLAATEIEDEPLWDGQAKSSRYQDFSHGGCIVPAEFGAGEAETYRTAAARSIEEYKSLHTRMVPHLSARLPRPDGMQEDAYRRNIEARAFDVARYLLFWGIPTNVGQVTSIRTLEKQIRRLKVSPYEELRSLAGEIAAACAEAPDCVWDDSAPRQPLSPTLARHVDPDTHAAQARDDLRRWADANLGESPRGEAPAVDLLKPANATADIAATLLYPVTNRPFRELYETACGWSEAVRAEVLDLAVRSRTSRDELLRGFRGGPYVFDIIMDIGAYRDLHRHRRCHQFRQEFGTELGFETPEPIKLAGLTAEYETAIREAHRTVNALPRPGSDYLLPFATRARFLFKMDFAEVEYIARLRTGVKGHFSYRQVAWQMKLRLEELEPELGRLIDATPPWVEDPLKR